jgi:hypothetical protein
MVNAVAITETPLSNARVFIGRPLSFLSVTSDSDPE